MNTVQLFMTWNAYTSKSFDAIYERHAEQAGSRPAMRVLHGGERAKVFTTSTDETVVRAIIAEAEAEVA